MAHDEKELQRRLAAEMSGKMDRMIAEAICCGYSVCPDTGVMLTINTIRPKPWWSFRVLNDNWPVC